MICDKITSIKSMEDNMKAWEIVKRLEEVPGRKEKEQILVDAFMNNCFEFFIGAQYAYDELVSFGVKQVALINEEDLDPQNSGTITFDDFEILLKKLAKRELTGHAARDAINDMAENCHGPTWNYFYRRILLKNLRCGTEVKTINKILDKLSAYQEANELKIPVFGCQLAHDGNKSPHNKKLIGNVMLQVKLDGVRLLTILDKEENTVKQYSRVGIENTNFSQITNQLLKILPKIKESIVLDGEVVDKNFSELMKNFGRKDKKANDSKLALFDIIPLKDFKKGYHSYWQENRHWLLSEFQTSGLFEPNGHVYVVPAKIVNLDTNAGQEEYKKFFNDICKMRKENETLEGVMVKKANAPYECKRTDSWLKIKPFVSVSLPVISVELGDQDGKFKDVIGNINCAGIDDGIEIEVSVSGIPDDKRKEWLTNPPIGMIAEIEADSYTIKEGRENVYSLRFPRLKGFRGFKPGEKL